MNKDTRPLNVLSAFNSVFHIIIVVFLSTLSASCSTEPDSQLPPQRPEGVVTGQVFDNVIEGATVSVYSINNGERGARLNDNIATTDEFGQFNVKIRAASQVVMVEAKGGSYTEQASGKDIEVGNRVLRALVQYASGEVVSILVTPLTHLTTALALHDVMQGIPADEALLKSKGIIDTFFTVDSANTLPLNLSEAATIDLNTNEPARYALILAGVSNWTAWASGKNNEAAHSTHTSIGLYQLMYEDIIADGALDGLSVEYSTAQPKPLLVGTVPLNVEAYRSMFSIHMMAVTTNDFNATQLKPTDVTLTAQDFAAKPSNLFGPQAPVLDLTLQKPTPSVTPLEGFKSGENIQVDISVAGLLGPQFINWTLCNQQHAIENPSTPQITINTMECEDGTHIVLLTVIDALGNSDTTAFNIHIDNELPTLGNVPPLVETNTPAVTLSGSYSDGEGSGLNSILVGDELATIIDGTQWTATINVAPGANTIQFSVIDNAGNNNTSYSTQVYLDDLPPTIIVGPHSQRARFVDAMSDNGFRQAPLDDYNTVPLYVETDAISIGENSRFLHVLDGIPIYYFVMAIKDEKSSPASLNFTSNLLIEVNYVKSDQLVVDWSTPIMSDCANAGIKSCGVIIPIATEQLTTSWAEIVAQSPEHTINFRVTDPAGNQRTQTFTFFAEFFPPD